MVDNFDANIMAAAFTNVNLVTHQNNAHDPDPDRRRTPLPTMSPTWAPTMARKGVYQCRIPVEATAGTCQSSRNSDGYVRLHGAEDAVWTFTPNAGAMAQVSDSVYLHFGWWLRENLEDAGSTGALRVELVYGSSSGTVYTLTDDVIGKASFEGPAAGKYALKDDLLDTAVGGHWTADVSLTADFRRWC